MRLPVIAFVLFGLAGTASAEDFRTDLQTSVPRRTRLMALHLLAPRDVARRLKVSTSRVTQLDREGKLIALRDASGRRFYDAKIVEQFAIAREQATGGPRHSDSAA